MDIFNKKRIRELEEQIENLQRKLDVAQKQPYFVEVKKSFKLDPIMPDLLHEIHREFYPVLSQDALRVLRTVMNGMSKYEFRADAAFDMRDGVHVFRIELPSRTLEIKTI